VTISFLIMTSVWTQVGRLSVAGPGSGTEAPAQTELPVTLSITTAQLGLSVGSSRFEALRVTRDSNGRMELGKLRGDFTALRAQYPDLIAIHLQTDDDIRYQDLVQVIDECIGAGLSAVSVAAGG
jgi:biopolymer transport protein TolR